MFVTDRPPTLKQMAGMTMAQLMSNLAAFVPYSVMVWYGSHQIHNEFPRPRPHSPDGTDTAENPARRKDSHQKQFLSRGEQI